MTHEQEVQLEMFANGNQFRNFCDYAETAEAFYKIISFDDAKRSSKSLVCIKSK